MCEGRPHGVELVRIKGVAQQAKCACTPFDDPFSVVETLDALSGFGRTHHGAEVLFESSADVPEGLVRFRDLTLQETSPLSVLHR